MQAVSGRWKDFPKGVIFMSMYVEKNLRPGEQIVAKARVSLAPMIPTVLISILLLIGSIAIGEGMMILIAFLIIAVMLFLHYIALTSNELGVINKKIIGKTGIIFNKSLDAYLDKIDNFSVSESFFGKLFGYATIRVCTNSAELIHGRKAAAPAFVLQPDGTARSAHESVRRLLQ